MWFPTSPDRRPRENPSPSRDIPNSRPKTTRRQGLARGGILLLFFLAGSQPGLAMQGKPAGDRIKAADYTSASVCGECHVDIYNSWKNSLHAFSLTDPIFDAAFMQAIKHGGQEARETCLRCHAPMTMLNRDFMLEQGVSREGVSCDFCHTVTAVHIGDAVKPFSVELGAVKRSVIKKAASPAHEVSYSELHGRSEFCAGCHNYRNSNGASIFSTYEEWLQGPYPAEGKQCQHCHMTLSPGRVVAPEVQESPGEIHLHNLIHDRDQLRGALAVRINRAARKVDGVSVEVEIENVGSGHFVPTGLPSRQVVLVVTAQIGNRQLKEERRYQKVVADAQNRVLKEDYAIILDGARVLSDNRIRPREKRIEKFEFHARPEGEIQVLARLVYQYRPTVMGVREMNIDLSRAERKVF